MENSYPRDSAGKIKSYYHVIFERRNILKDSFYTFFLALSSWPRLILEVFLRRDMGCRYFSIASVISVLVLLWFLPFTWSGYQSVPHILKDNALWYLFTLVFLGFGIKRWREVDASHTFNLERFSLSMGTPLPIFYEYGFTNKIIRTVLEPAPAFIIGGLLWLMGDRLGELLVFCSVVYSLSHVAAYDQGNNYILTQIDEWICQQELTNSFREAKDPRYTRGFEFVQDIPGDKQTRERIINAFWQDDDDEAPEVR